MKQQIDRLNHTNASFFTSRSRSKERDDNRIKNKSMRLKIDVGNISAFDHSNP